MERFDTERNRDDATVYWASRTEDNYDIHARIWEAGLIIREAREWMETKDVWHEPTAGIFE